MEGLPLLPGYSFSSSDPTSKDNKLKQKLKFLNGFRVIRDSYDPDDFSCSAKYAEYDPSLTYGRRRRAYDHREEQRFVPHYALYSRKCLSFEAYFRQGVFGSPTERWRVRRVKIYYYLEDDTMSVSEPRVKNAGFRQGKLVRRGKTPRWGEKGEEDGRFYHWKDLNVGMDIGIYGVVYRTVDCDTFTREFLTSQGIDVGPAEDLPPDPYLQSRAAQEQQLQLAPCSGKDASLRLAADKRYRFLEFDGMILSFDASWNEDAFKLRYFLAEDTMAVCEVRRRNDGKVGSLMLKRTKVPKNWKDLPTSYPGVCMERSDEDVREYYSPSDLKVGETIFIFGRRFLLHDCDPFTRKYYSQMLHIDQPPRIPLPSESQPVSCPQRPKTTPSNRESNQKDLIRRIYNFPKRLRYSLVLDVVRPEDEGREFVLEYSLADGTVRILELERRNSGRLGGCFLGWHLVPKPGREGECYTPEDFGIGSRLNVFGHWFVVTGTEPFVYKYMMANPQKFGERLRENIGEYLRGRGLIQEEVRCGEEVTREGDEEVKNVCGGGEKRELMGE